MYICTYLARARLRVPEVALGVLEHAAAPPERVAVEPRHDNTIYIYVS